MITVTLQHDALLFRFYQAAEEEQVHFTTENPGLGRLTPLTCAWVSSGKCLCPRRAEQSLREAPHHAGCRSSCSQL